MTRMTRLLAVGAALVAVGGAELATAPSASAFVIGFAFPMALPLPVPLPPPPPPVVVARRVAFVPPPVVAPPPPPPVYAPREVVYIAPRPVYRYGYRRVMLREYYVPARHRFVHRAARHVVHHVVYRSPCGCR